MPMPFVYAQVFNLVVRVSLVHNSIDRDVGCVYVACGVPYLFTVKQTSYS